ncbi:MAG: phosphatidate cytidylyltransferase [Bacteroidetes bacterium]|nr:phosphatidate cytidylyltransferase [Bacteroidota bacterium]
MALNLKTFRTRSLTAAVFVIVMLAGLLWTQWGFFILFSVIHFGCWSEYQKLIGKIEPSYTQITPFHKYGVRVAGWCIMLYLAGNQLQILGIHIAAIGWPLGIICVFVLPIIELLFARHLETKNIALSALGLIYISLSWGLLMDLGNYFLMANDRDYFRYIPIVLIASIWINDTMAYIVGSLIGKTPFSKISPKKTWEGTAGGALLCVLVVSLAGHYITPLSRVPVQHWIVISAIAAVAGTAGDLLESKLKRMADVKDSGSFMPGHGGFLDRFDSLLLATPFVWIYVALFMQNYRP